MYDFLLFVHVGSVMVYFLFHGAIASVTFALKRETSDGQRQALSSVLDRAYRVAPLALLTLVLSGILLGLLGRWWSDGWIWVSILALVVLAVFMFVVGGLYFDRRFEAVDDRPWAQQAQEGTATHRLVHHPLMDRHHAKIPLLLTASGVTVMGVILWLMMFKPF